MGRDGRLKEKLKGRGNKREGEKGKGEQPNGEKKRAKSRKGKNLRGKNLIEKLITIERVKIKKREGIEPSTKQHLLTHILSTTTSFYYHPYTHYHTFISRNRSTLSTNQSHQWILCCARRDTWD